MFVRLILTVAREAMAVPCRCLYRTDLKAVSALAVCDRPCRGRISRERCWAACGGTRLAQSRSLPLAHADVAVGLEHERLHLAQLAVGFAQRLLDVAFGDAMAL
jgi:hypothetical protein